MTKDEQSDIRRDFGEAVNMTGKELSDWLDSDDSKAVGQKSSSGSESTGHESGRRILEIQKRKVSDYDDDDYAHMKKVVGYVKRHLAQRPSGNVDDTAWRYSLMNWGHDPLKK